MAKTIGAPNTVLGPGLKETEPELAKEPELEQPSKSKFEQPEGTAELVTLAPAKPEEFKNRKQWRFVKNIDTDRPVRFRDGTIFIFKSPLLVTADPVLAAKLLSVADKNHIVQ
jgi:hypothetical protein